MSAPVVIAGPTGTGKSRLALALAHRIGGEIVNYDSVQVYRGFDIGSAKPSPESRAEVPHHLIDVVDATEEFHAAAFADRVRKVCDGIAGRGARAILVGGTGFYLRAFLSGLPELPGRDDEIRRRIQRTWSHPRGAARLRRMLERVDPVSASRIALGDRHRVERAIEVWLASGRPISSWERPSADAEVLPSLKFALSLERAALNIALDARVDEMYRAGLVDETRSLLARYPADAHPFGTIGYKEAAAVVRGELSAEAAVAETKRRTRAYAKRQMTWLRGERNITWLDAGLPVEQLVEVVVRVVN